MRPNTRHYILRRIVAFLLLLPSVYMVFAQELEYKMELGAMAGGCFYMGDANFSVPLKNTAMAGGIMARYNFNPRMVVKGDLAVGKLHGSTEGNKNQFPNGHTTFSRTVFELGGQFEYNFFAYGSGAGYKDSHRLTPYVLAGAGITYAPKPKEHIFALNIPVGLGIKYKLVDRVNVGAEWTMRFTTSDKFDVTNLEGAILDDPYQITSKGIKNKDSYSMLIAYISYDLFPKYRKCNN